MVFKKMMKRCKFDESMERLLLYRFFLVVLAVNLVALPVDFYSKRPYYIAVEAFMAFGMVLGIAILCRCDKIKWPALYFFLVVSVGLFVLIGISHFGTMSLLFVLLLPLTVMLFLEGRYIVLLEILQLAVLGTMLYVEYKNNPTNPILQHPNALYHLAYTAGIIFVFGFLYHASIRMTLRELDASNKKNKLLLKEVYHRVKNNLNVIASMIGLQARILEKDEREPLLKSKHRIESIAMVHEMLYRSNDLEHVDFRAYMQKLSSLLLRMYGAENIEIRIEGENTGLELDTMVQLGIILNELLTNSVKYAFEETQRAEVCIRLEKEAKGYRFVYKDNGTSVKNIDALTKGQTLGLKLVHLAAKQLKGEVNVCNENGLKYEIRFYDG
jgi:two-component sensor histidine kinase